MVYVVHYKLSNFYVQNHRRSLFICGIIMGSPGYSNSDSGQRRDSFLAGQWTSPWRVLAYDECAGRTLDSL